MDKYCIINQPAGLGDIILCQKIAWHYHNLGYLVLWVVKDVYYESVLKHLKNDNTVFITEEYVKQMFGDKNLFHPEYSDNFVYLPLDGSTQFSQTQDLVESKFEVARVDGFDDWVEYVALIRDKDRELELYNRFGLEDKEYILVNNNVGSPPNSVKKPFDINTDKHIVNLDFIEGYNIFDWLTIIENAEEIWTVDTVIHYLMDLPSVALKAKRLEMYSRYTPANFDYVVKKVVKNKNWNFNY